MITVIRPLSAGNMIISLSFCRSFIALSSLTGRLLLRLVAIWWRICCFVSSGISVFFSVDSKSAT